MRSFRLTSRAFALGTVALLSATAPALAESAGDYLDDAAITTKIKASLIKDDELKAFDIHVDTDHAIVHLSGTVGTMMQKTDAVRVAKTTTHVRDVVNDIIVTPK
jgi:osmotically-inducible protein OsmY